MLALFLGADQWLKWLVRTRMEPGATIPLIPGYLHLTYVQNTGAAFGLWRGTVGFLTLVSVAVIIVLLVSLRQDTGPSARGAARQRRYGTWLVLAGALGNLIDRLLWGYVVDFVDLRVWPVFNLADSAITIGVILLVWGMWRSTRAA